jgi:hypothetical protein
MSDGLIILFTLCGLALLGSATFIAVALIRRGTPTDVRTLTHSIDTLNERVARLEVAVDSTSADVTRLEDAQRFTEQLLQDRAAPDTLRAT